MNCPIEADLPIVRGQLNSDRGDVEILPNSCSNIKFQSINPTKHTFVKLTFIGKEQDLIA